MLEVTIALSAVGLSPRVRGSHPGRPRPPCPPGPIPAGAGEPDRARCISERRWAYPRGCGGAIIASQRPQSVAGLSPRVRGSLPCCSQPQASRGPIPAGAGEPSARARAGRGSGAYPRGCGGALDVGPTNGWAMGLSPRVRGSLGAQLADPLHDGPIPAGAGEPWHPSGRRPARRAYPRGCGGANEADLAKSQLTGLSPRVRGSRAFNRVRVDHGGPIPAGAGEP